MTEVLIVPTALSLVPPGDPVFAEFEVILDSLASPSRSKAASLSIVEVATISFGMFRVRAGSNQAEIHSIRSQPVLGQLSGG